MEKEEINSKRQGMQRMNGDFGMLKMDRSALS